MIDPRRVVFGPNVILSSQQRFGRKPGQLNLAARHPRYSLQIRSYFSISQRP